MKMKTTVLSYDEVLKIQKPRHRDPVRPNFFFSSLMRLVAVPDLAATKFSYTEKESMKNAGNGPWLVLMNHSSFLDLEIASKILYPKKYNIVCTTDGFVGKADLMYNLGCIPTNKFIPDMQLIADISTAIKKNNTSVLMYPEASYSFDGRTTPLPRRLGVFIKRLSVPVVMITTYGSFARDPLYNNLQKRKVQVSATVECLLNTEQIKEKNTAEIDAILNKAFDLDYFRWQQENKIIIDEPFRADELNRILYKCACCKTEGQMTGKGTTIKCAACGKEYELDEKGFLKALSGETEFNHIPDWNQWQREEVRKEIEAGTYSLETEVEIGVLADFKSLYMVGKGVLKHNLNGFTLDGCEGELHYEQTPTFSYSTYSDFYWYEIGDVISIGDKNYIYYCFPKQKDIVSKVRIATEEMYKLNVKKQ